MMYFLIFLKYCLDLLTIRIDPIIYTHPKLCRDYGLLTIENISILSMTSHQSIYKTQVNRSAF